jgi:hypothetical protein
MAIRGTKFGGLNSEAEMYMLRREVCVGQPVLFQNLMLVKGKVDKPPSHENLTFLVLPVLAF